jgi:hypothetical protein
MNSSSPDPAKARLMSAIAARPSRTRSAGRRRALVFGTLSAATALGIFAGVGGYAHASNRPPAISIALAGGWALTSAVLTQIALARTTSTLGARRAVLLAVGVVTPVLLFGWMHLFSRVYVAPAPQLGLRCLALTLAIGALPLATFLSVRRGADPRAPAALGAAAGSVSGAWAAVLVDLWCPDLSGSHVLLGHVAPVVLLAIVGAIAGGKTLATRA